MIRLKTYQCPGCRGSNPSYAHGSASAPLAGRFTSSFIPSLLSRSVPHRLRSQRKSYHPRLSSTEH